MATSDLTEDLNGLANAEFQVKTLHSKGASSCVSFLLSLNLRLNDDIGVCG